ncbi:nucleotidyltransferase family protein [Jannaschia sp. R86511]|uniref:nucleotidyltransferase family protein n=1 Tax=Jannaschia sp. R86511 TaxID=3093853 RepID=UPI0036D41AA5
MVAAVRAFALGTRLTEVPAPGPWLAAAHRHGVATVVADVLRRSDLALPPELAAARFTGPAALLRTMADLTPLARRLDDAGVRWLAVKGPVLAGVVYRTPNVRSYNDLDVLVHPLDLPVVLDLLREHGARLLDRNWEQVARSGQAQISWALPHGTKLDLHWHLVNREAVRARIGERTPALLERRTRVTLEQTPVWSLDPLDLVLHTAQHACLSGAHALKWLLDVQQALAWAGPDPADLARRAQAAHLDLVLAVVADRTARYVDPGVLRHVRPPVHGAAWRAAARAVSDRVPPGDPGRWSGRAVYASTRRDTPGSALATVRTLRRNVLRRAGEPVPSSIGLERGTTRDRDAWLGLAARHG